METFADSLWQANHTVDWLDVGGERIPRFTGEYWTAKQRQASAIHEVSYRGCFKAQLPRFFITQLTREGELVYDPFSGRGTTAIEAGLLGRRVVANDVNPLSRVFALPRLNLPEVADVARRLEAIPAHQDATADIDLSMFYHPTTEAEIVSLRDYLRTRATSQTEDEIDSWIRMVATNRLTGHSPGFFSVYSLPPNQAVSPRRQHKINLKLRQQPAYRNTSAIILKKTESLHRGLTPEQKHNLRRSGETARFLTKDATSTTEIPSDAVRLTVTSPPFLDVVQYAADNWLRAWFNGINSRAVSERLTMTSTLEAWSLKMSGVFAELYRVTQPGGWVAFEVGEVRNRTIKLDETVVPLGMQAGFECKGILVNAQPFTKTSNIWGIKNNHSGTNTNRIALFRKPGPSLDAHRRAIARFRL